MRLINKNPNNPKVRALTTEKQNHRIELKKVTTGDKVWYFASRCREPDKKAVYDDGAVIAAVYDDDKQKKNREGKKSPRIIYEVNLRPPLLTKCEADGTVDYKRAISVEMPAGLAIDGDSADTLKETAIKELEEETGCNVEDGNIKHTTKGLVSAGGMSDETSSIFVAKCENPGNSVKPQKPDSGQLAIISVPLKKALQYLLNLAKHGISVATVAFASTASALEQFKVTPQFGDFQVPVDLLWKKQLKNDPSCLQRFALSNDNTKTRLDRIAA